MTIERALALAAANHAGQTYGNGPYILHPMRVMLAVPSGFQVVAILHDVLEDTKIDRLMLAAELSSAEWAALNLLTRSDNETYGEYILGITTATGPGASIAQTVKRADLDDHLGRMTPQFSSLELRYRQARKLLS